MAESLLREEVNVYSEKYDVHGVVRDYGVVTKLFFSYEGRDMVIGITRNIFKGETFEDVGRNTIESYIANLSAHEEGRKLRLHYWYIEEREHKGQIYRIGHGIVTGHNRLMDSTDIHTSPIQGISINEDEGELEMITLNSVYHCPLSYCSFRRQDEYPNLIPEYEKLKEKYKDTKDEPSIEPGKVLLVLSNFDEYYFHSLYYVPEDSETGECIEYRAWPHIGSFQDSYLISAENTSLKYFPHFLNIQIYQMITNGCPLYIENVGDTVLYAKTPAGLIRLNPGDRKEVSEENAEKEKPFLPGGDLYPAGII